jgi:hypothetical protein
MTYRFRPKIIYLSIISALLISLGLLGLWRLGREILFPARLKVGEAYSINRSPYWENLYAHSFQCVNVEEIKLQLFFIRAGEATELWDGYYRRTSGAPPSSSCLFTLISDTSADSPRVDFSFAGGSYSGGGGVDLPLTLIQSLEETSDLDSQEAFEQRSSTQVVAPEGMSIDREKPVLFYYEYYYPSGQEVPSLLRVSSIEEVKELSSEHQNLSFLAVNLLWSE